MSEEQSEGQTAIASHAQEGLWFTERLVGGSPANTICRAYAVSGELDVEALRSAWRTLAGRHESLCTSVLEVDGRPVQTIDPTRIDTPALVDLAEVPPADREAVADERCATLAGTPLGRDGEALARMTVLRLSATEHRVLLLVHRLVCDDSSIPVLVEELSECYAAAVERRGAVLPFLPLQYRDYTSWEREREARPAFQRLTDWWTSALTPPPPPLSIPADRPPDHEPAVDGATVRFDWGEDFGRQLQEVSAAEATVPGAVLLTAFQTLLFRYTGEERVAVGYPAPVRPRPEFARTVGPFQNTLVLCADFSGEPTFREMLGRVTQGWRDALDHRELPFTSLMAALDIDRHPWRVPLFDTVFSLAEPESPLSLPGATVRSLPVHTGTIGSDLALSVEQVDPAVTGALEYRTSRFEADSVRRILDQLRTMLDAALKDPGLPVTALPLDTPDQIRVAVREADHIGPPATGSETVNGLVHRAAELKPLAPALSWQGTEISYRELVSRAAAITEGLRSLGVAPGTTVAVRMASGPSQVASVLAVLDAGASVVCLGAGDAGERARLILSDLRPPCLLLDGDPAEDELAGWYQQELGGQVADVGAMDGPGADGYRQARPDERVYVAYTSGSTGRPKGIAQSHASFAQFTGWFAEHLGFGPDARVAQWAAPAYDAALCQVFGALRVGATLCPVPERIRIDPKRLVRWLIDERITHFETVPSFARELLRAIASQKAADELGTLEHFLLAGEPLPGELAGRLRATLPSVRLTNMYGPTEIVLATWHEVTGEVRGTVPIGQSIPGRQVLIVDDQDRPCPAGITGELVIRSPHITPGYLNPDADSSSFRPLRGRAELGLADGNWYRTGDMGRRRWDGLLEFGGRQDFQIKFYGTRLELTDVETALGDQESVAECAIVPVTDHNGLVVRLMAYVVPRGTPSDDLAAELTASSRTRLRRRFGKLLPPVSIRLLEKLPRNVGGKVDRRRLPAPASLRAPAEARPPTRTEREMAAIWAELLATDEIDGADSFFALGGHSILVLTLLHEIRERFGADVPLHRFMADPTLAATCELVEAQRNVEVQTT